MHAVFWLENRMRKRHTDLGAQVCFKETGPGDTGWIELAQDWVHWGFCNDDVLGFLKQDIYVGELNEHELLEGDS